MFYRVGQSFQQIVDFILPPRCINCERSGQLLCAECQAELTWMKSPICDVCGRPSRSAQLVCDGCLQNRPAYHTTRATLLFVAPLPTIIHQFKYYNSFALARPLAEAMASAWMDWRPADQVDWVCPIPLHPDRLKERGYNQSALLAYHFSQIVNLPYTDVLLHRTKNTPPQARLDRAKRIENVRDAFAVGHGDLTGKHILLVDDVCTTGATLDAAALCLRSAGAQNVSAYCLARAA